MIEVDIPSIDPIQHEPKLIFGLTLRQAICVIVGGGLGIGSYFIIQNLTGSIDLSMIVMCIFLFPAVMMGWYKPYNMKAEDFLKLVYYNNFIAYPTRILKSDNAEDIKLPTLKERQEMEKKLQQAELKKRKEKAAQKNKSKGGPR